MHQERQTYQKRKMYQKYQKYPKYLPRRDLLLYQKKKAG